MASAMARATLARAALALNAPFLPLPHLILMTDEKRLADPVGAASLLPRHTAVILRHTDSVARARLAERLSAIAQARGLFLLVAGDAALAARIDADGIHLPEARLHEAAHWRALHPSWFITVAAHSESALARAARSLADAAVLAPAFPTRSHMGRGGVGVARFRFMAQRAALPVYALGGINAQSVRRLTGARLAGIAAIEGLTGIQSA